jgi:CCR4-NOT transcription complex subunit 4
MSYIESENKLMKQRSVKRQEFDFSEMADARIITKNLVYVIGLSSKIASKEILESKEYFGQYGTIIKTVVNKNKAYNSNNPKGPSFSAYITYSKPYEASIAILSLDNIVVNDHLIRASFGTTK